MKPEREDYYKIVCDGCACDVRGFNSDTDVPYCRECYEMAYPHCKKCKKRVHFELLDPDDVCKECLEREEP